MPTGISSGRTASRAPTSIQIIKTAPHKADRGIRRRWSAPTTDRTRWGMTSPTKPMQPLTATAEAVSRAEDRMSTPRTRSRSTPRVTAELSPMSMAFRGRARAISTRNRGGRISASRGRSSHLALPSPPSIQKVASRTAASSGAV